MKHRLSAAEQSRGGNAAKTSRDTGTRILNRDWIERERAEAAKQLKIEIAAAKSETLHAAPYRGGWPDDV